MNLLDYKEEMDAIPLQAQVEFLNNLMKYHVLKIKDIKITKCSIREGNKLYLIADNSTEWLINPYNTGDYSVVEVIKKTKYFNSNNITSNTKDVLCIEVKRLMILVEEANGNNKRKDEEFDALRFEISEQGIIIDELKDKIKRIENEKIHWELSYERLFPQVNQGNRIIKNLETEKKAFYKRSNDLNELVTKKNTRIENLKNEHFLITRLKEQYEDIMNDLRKENKLQDKNNIALKVKIEGLETEKQKLKLYVDEKLKKAQKNDRQLGCTHHRSGITNTCHEIEQFEKETKITMDKSEEFYKKLNKKLSENKIILYKGYEVERIECEVERTFRDEPMGHTGKNRKISMKKWITYTIYFHIDGMPGSNKVDELNPDDFEFKDPGEK